MNSINQKLPLWKQRRIKLLEKCSTNPAFQNAVISSRTSNSLNEIGFLGKGMTVINPIMYRFGLPIDTYGCVYDYVVSDEWDWSLLISPISYKSHFYGKKGSSYHPEIDYSVDLIKSKARDPDFRINPNEIYKTIISIEPGVTQSELLDWIKKNWKELAPTINLKEITRLKAQRQKDDLYQDRNNEVVKLRQRGMKIREIAEAQKMDERHVKNVLKAKGMGRQRKSGT